MILRVSSRGKHDFDAIGVWRRVGAEITAGEPRIPCPGDLFLHSNFLLFGWYELLWNLSFVSVAGYGKEREIGER